MKGFRPWLNLTGYKHVRPDQIEDEPFLWEA